MAVNRIDLLNHSFTRVLRGYDPDEVDGIMQEAADAIARLSDERVRLTNHINQIESRIADYAQREAVLRDTLLATQKMGENLKSSAQREAQFILDAAQTKADNLAAQASMRLARILDEIADARKLKVQFEFKVRSVIESHLKLLELGQIEDAHMERAVAALSEKPAPKREDRGS